jgi:hypothetical protein
MQLSFYVDECLPPWLAAVVSSKRGYHAVHAKNDLGFGGRTDEFHFETARKRPAPARPRWCCGEG